MVAAYAPRAAVLLLLSAAVQSPEDRALAVQSLVALLEMDPGTTLPALLAPGCCAPLGALCGDLGIWLRQFAVIIALAVQSLVALREMDPGTALPALLATGCCAPSGAPS